MLEDTFWEEDIWEYKSKRKPKPVHSNNCSENISESVEKATDGKYQSKGKGNKKRTSENLSKQKDHKVCLAETDSQISAGSSQNSSCKDEIHQSQSKETTPKKQCRTHRGKQVTPKVRPVYDGYCPSCQMPFSSLLGQTPRWHVFECLESPPISDTECPEGLLCTSTIPSHYKKYTHILLAQSRDSNEPLSPSHELAGRFTAAEPDSSHNLEEKQSVLLKTGNSRKVLEDSLLMIQCLKTSQPPAETNRKSASSPWSQMSLVPQCAEFVKRDQLVGGGSPLAEVALNSQSKSGSTGLPLPENDCGDCEISYSPLHSEEETYDIDQELDDSQQELFFTQSSKDSSLEEDGAPVFENLYGPSPKEAEEIRPTSKSLVAQARCSALTEGSTLNDSFRLTSHTASRLSPDDPSGADSVFLLLSPASAVGGSASNYQTTKAKPRYPEKSHSLASSYQQQKTETSAVGNPTSLPLFVSAKSKPLEKEEVEPLYLTQSQTGGLQSNSLGAPGANCACRNTQNRSSMSLDRPLRASPSSPKRSASQPSKKVMKQTDIGVFFGLPPKTQDTPPRERASEGLSVSPAMSPSQKRPGVHKRPRVQSPLSNSEFDAKNSNDSQHSIELSGERTQHARKRQRKSDSPQEGTYQRRPGHFINKPEFGTVSLNKGRAFARRTHGRMHRGGVNISESSGAGELRRTCPFYKKIPGTGFTVDAFQYGEVDGCTAYFLTHFHSDHYAGLSKDFTGPVYCSEITGNLLKKKLRVQEQYIHPLPMDTECVVDGVRVVLLDANHCPGATMILFQLPNGNVILHTGDFRADPSMERSLLSGHKVHTLFLDTTYCSPEYTFPSQQEVIQFAINTTFEAVTLNPHVLVVCGTYCIGKEKVFLAIADVLGSKVGMSQEKYRTLQCLNIPEVSALITTDMCNSTVHLLPMMEINFKGLQSHLKKCDGKYNQILAFRPTGWTHSNNISSIADIIPQTKGNISIYGIPYSEHSSYLEMKRFVQWLRPQKIIPTVNVGTSQSRSTMEKYFKEWRLEAGY